MTIARAAVVGAGVMGSGIAAHIANAGVPVLLLDVVPPGAGNRNIIAQSAIERLLRSEPAPFMTARAAKLVEPANIEDHLGLLAAADWIVEAVVERLDVKRDLYRRVEAVRKRDSVVSSNTSTLPLALLVEGLPASFARDFLITHFFNPPRYMRLLEIVAGPATRPEALEAIVTFADRMLGKGVVLSHDTPGFVANRIGTFWIQCAIAEALDRGLTVEEADAILGRPIGVPKTGVFGLMDLVGIDLMPQVDRNLAQALPPEDAYHAIRRELPMIEEMIGEGYTGRKGKGGFYRLSQVDGRRVKEARDLESGAYRPSERPSLDSLEAAKSGGLKALVEHSDRGGHYAWAVLSQTLAYAASLVPEIADDVNAVDRAMRLGYNWKQGPFELIDALGAADLAQRLAEEGAKVPPLLATAAEVGGFYRVADGRLLELGPDGSFAEVPRSAGILLLSDVKLRSQPLAKNGSASLWDIGEGVTCFEIHTKLNTIDPDVLALLRKAIKITAGGYKALVIYNEGEQFSAGANLGLALFAANTALWPMIEGLVAEGQETYAALKRAPFPVVAAPSGLALGGGCEILLHADAVQAHAESYIGLVEVGVGLVPAWGGCKELLLRLAGDPDRPHGPMPPVTAAFETIGLAAVSRSAFEAKEKGFLKRSDGITFNRDRLLTEAKEKALALVAGYRPPAAGQLALPGRSGKAALLFALKDLKSKGLTTPHDERVAERLAEVLTGGPEADHTMPLSEEAVLELERAAFMNLIRTDPTLARMEHTLETGRPLRN